MSAIENNMEILNFFGLLKKKLYLPVTRCIIQMAEKSWSGIAHKALNVLNNKPNMEIQEKLI